MMSLSTRFRVFSAWLQHVRGNEDGQALVEYTLILGLISVIAITALTGIGNDVNAILGAIKAALDHVPGA